LVPSGNRKVTCGWTNYSCKVTSQKMTLRFLEFGYIFFLLFFIFNHNFIMFRIKIKKKNKAEKAGLKNFYFFCWKRNG
jgi:hypothetical protein